MLERDKQKHNYILCGENAKLLVSEQLIGKNYYYDSEV